MVSKEWADKLAIRELLERYMRYNDDGDLDRIIELFEEDAELMTAGRRIVGREGIRSFWLQSGYFTPGIEHWTAPGRDLIQPRSVHVASNPIIEVQGDAATAESDFVVVVRTTEGRAKVALAGRYRDRLLRTESGGWRIASRKGVSVARPGEEGTDSEWQAAMLRGDIEVSS